MEFMNVQTSVPGSQVEGADARRRHGHHGLSDSTKTVTLLVDR